MRTRQQSKAKAEPVFTVICKFDFGEPQILQTTFYEVTDENGEPTGDTATVTKRIDMMPYYCYYQI